MERQFFSAFSAALRSACRSVTQFSSHRFSAFIFAVSSRRLLSCDDMQLAVQVADFSHELRSDRERYQILVH